MRLAHPDASAMTTNAKTFRAIVQRGHKGCAVEVPFNPRTTWGVEASVSSEGGVRGVPVKCTAARAKFDSCIVYRWGKYFLLLDDENLDAARATEGEEIAITVTPVSGASTETESETKS